MPKELISLIAIVKSIITWEARQYSVPAIERAQKPQSWSKDSYAPYEATLRHAPAIVQLILLRRPRKAKVTDASTSLGHGQLFRNFGLNFFSTPAKQQFDLVEENDDTY